MFEESVTVIFGNGWWFIRLSDSSYDAWRTLCLIGISGVIGVSNSFSFLICLFTQFSIIPFNRL